MSELKYKVGDRVRIKSIDWYNENKDNRNEITFKNNPHWRFVANQSDYCGQIATIISVSKNAYRLEHIPWNWTDEMIEGLVEEETKSKFKVGDRVITDTNMKGKIIEDVEEGWYRVEFEPHNSIPQPNGVVPEESMSLMEEKTEPKFKVGDKIKLKSTLLNDIFGVIGYESEGYRITNISNGLTYFMSYSIEHYYELVEEEVGLVDNLSSRWVNEFNLPEGYIFKDENGNEILTSKIILEKKKNEYPKTYEECCKVLNVAVRDFDILYNMLDTTEIIYINELDRLLNSVRKLLICRDAYWKIAGDEMGLGKPWEPDYNDLKNTMYGLYDELKYSILNPSQFVFPTKKIRDAFKENFDTDIKICKELL